MIIIVKSWFIGCQIDKIKSVFTNHFSILSQYPIYLFRFILDFLQYCTSLLYCIGVVLCVFSLFLPDRNKFQSPSKLIMDTSKAQGTE